MTEVSLALSKRRAVPGPLEDEGRRLRLPQVSHCDPSTPAFSPSLLRKLFMIWHSTLKGLQKEDILTINTWISNGHLKLKVYLLPFTPKLAPSTVPSSQVIEIHPSRCSGKKPQPSLTLSFSYIPHPIQQHILLTLPSKYSESNHFSPPPLLPSCSKSPRITAITQLVFLVSPPNTTSSYGPISTLNLSDPIKIYVRLSLCSAKTPPMASHFIQNKSWDFPGGPVVKTLHFH